MIQNTQNHISKHTISNNLYLQTLYINSSQRFLLICMARLSRAYNSNIYIYIYSSFVFNVLLMFCGTFQCAEVLASARLLRRVELRQHPLTGPSIFFKEVWPRTIGAAATGTASHSGTDPLTFLIPVCLLFFFGIFTRSCCVSWYSQQDILKRVASHKGRPAAPIETVARFQTGFLASQDFSQTALAQLGSYLYLKGLRFASAPSKLPNHSYQCPLPRW